MKRESLLPYSLVALVLIVATSLLLFGRANVFSINIEGKSSDTGVPPLPQPPATCGYCSARLLNVSPEEIGQYAVEQAITRHEASGNTPQVVLARMVNPEDFPGLGLGCPPDFAAIEQPPLALVILKGDMRPNVPGMQPTISPVEYIAYVFDLWAGVSTMEISSPDGGAFRKALNDPNLPAPHSDMPTVCPTPVPYAKTLHYGDAAPGFDVPPRLPQDIQEHLQPTTQPPPQPTVSATVPEPIPTTEGLPIIPPPMSTHEATGTTPQTGSSAIQPTIMGAGPNEPAFTEADVRSFFAQRYADFGDPSEDGGPPQITDIEFMAVGALQQKLGQPFNLQMSDQALICYVELSGKFPYSHPYSPNPDAWKPYLTRVAQIFDAHTGNFLMLVGLDGE